jgi:4-amino-4-deoxy-L-arabinose transferase-like glycosyltransferase
LQKPNEQPEARAWRWLVLAVLAGALALRLVAAASAPFTADETGQLHGGRLSHPPLAVFLAHSAAALGGESPFVVRLPFVILSVVGLAFVYPLARRGFGRWPALLALVLLSVDQFHLIRSRTASEAVALAFVPPILYFFYRAAAGSRPNFFVVAGVLLGVGFYAKEDVLLLLPALFLFLLWRRERRRWLRAKELLLGLVAVAVCVAGYVLFDSEAADANFGRALSRSAGVGLTLRGTSLYLGELLIRMVGTPIETAEFVWILDRWSEEVPPMNWVAGLLCLTAAVYTTDRYRNELTSLLLWVFWPIFTVASMVAPAHGFFELDQIKWAGATVVPAALLAAELLYRRAAPWRLGQLLAVALLGYLIGNAVHVSLVRDNIYSLPAEVIQLRDDVRRPLHVPAKNRVRPHFSNPVKD